MNHCDDLGITYDTLPSDPAARHESLVDAFGRQLFWRRRHVLERVKLLVEDEAVRSRLGTIVRRPYEQVAELDADARTAALGLAQVTLDRFAEEILSFLAHQGIDLPMGDDHVLRLRLVMEICDLEYEEVVEEEVINRGGCKFLPDYWGRWLNRYASRPSSTGDCHE